MRVLLILSLVFATTHEARANDREVDGYKSRRIEGWTVRVAEPLLADDAKSTERALELLTVQLREIVGVVPAPAVVELRKTTLWFSPEYERTPPRAEYHPDAGWLRKNNRNTAMAGGVEFTNVKIFEREVKRMPNFALHELSHAYHHRVLDKGFDNPDIRAAFDRAKASGDYDRVERRFGDGRTAIEKAYALTSPQEFFAEASEAYFTTNDFFPYNATDLARHDPKTLDLLKSMWTINPSDR
ncbi:MAG: hypothetical protein QM811_19945 [Pirellulales bacterium]